MSLKLPTITLVFILRNCFKELFSSQWSNFHRATAFPRCNIYYSHKIIDTPHVSFRLPNFSENLIYIEIYPFLVTNYFDYCVCNISFDIFCCTFEKKTISVVFALKVSLNILYNFFCTKDDSPLQYTFSWVYLYNFLMILHAWLRLGPEISFFLAIFLFRRLQASDYCRTPEVFYKKAFIKNFAKLCRKTPVLEPLFNKVAGLQVCNFIKN